MASSHLIHSSKTGIAWCFNRDVTDHLVIGIYEFRPSTIARNTALARGRRAKQPKVDTALPWRLAAYCWLYCICSDIFNAFNSPYLHSILSIAIIVTPECQHCTVWQWAALWARGNGKFKTITQRKFDLKCLVNKCGFVKSAAVCNKQVYIWEVHFITSKWYSRLC